DRCRLKAVLRKHGRGIRPVLGDDQAEVRTLLSYAGADAGREESLRQFKRRASSASRAASRTRSGDVPPAVLFRASTDSSVTPCSFARSWSFARLLLTMSCASRNGVPCAAIASATA